VQLGTAMLAAGDSVDAVSSTLRRILGAYSLHKSGVIVLQTVLLVETGHGPTARVQHPTIEAGIEAGIEAMITAARCWLAPGVAD